MRYGPWSQVGEVKRQRLRRAIVKPAHAETTPLRLPREY